MKLTRKRIKLNQTKSSLVPVLGITYLCLQFLPFLKDPVPRSLTSIVYIPWTSYLSDFPLIS